MFTLGNFPVTVELASLAGTELEAVLAQARKMRADAFNLPDGILGRLTIDPLVLAARVKEGTGKPVIAHLTCRDSTRLGLASRLLGAANFQVEAILALSGDSGSRNVFEVRAPGLVTLIKGLNAGRFDAQQLKSKTQFKIGVAVNPNVENQVEYLKSKIECGADFVQTQPVFSLATAENFLAALKKARIKLPVLLGIMPLKSAVVAEYFNQNVVGVEIPAKVVERLQEEPGSGTEIALELLAEIRSELQGVHLMPLGQVEAANRIYDFLKG